MPRRRNSLTAAFSIRRAQADANADRRARRQIHPMLALELPALDQALHGGLPFNRLTEITGSGPGKTLLAARAIASLHRQVPHANAIWLDFAADTDHDLLVAAGVDDARLRVVQSQGVAMIQEFDAAHAGPFGARVHAFVISGLPPYRRGDYLYAGVVQQIAMTAPWTRAVVIFLTDPGSDRSPLDRLAAVRIRLSHEAELANGQTGHRLYMATATIIKNRFGNGGLAVPLAIPLE